MVTEQRSVGAVGAIEILSRVTIIDCDDDTSVEARRYLLHPAERLEIDFRSIAVGQIEAEPLKVLGKCRLRQRSKAFHKPSVSKVHEDFLQFVPHYLNAMDGEGIRQFVAEHDAGNTFRCKARHILQPGDLARAGQPGSELFLL